MRGNAESVRNAAAPSRVFSVKPILGRAMTANVSTWIRTFRPPLQRAYSRVDETDRDLADLLRQADERTPQRDAPASADPPRKS